MADLQRLCRSPSWWAGWHGFTGAWRWPRLRTTASDRDRVWAVEDCRHVSRRLERDLLAAGERIVRVPPKLMAAARSSIRSAGKSAIDALAVARAGPGRRDGQAVWLDQIRLRLRQHLQQQPRMVSGVLVTIVAELVDHVRAMTTRINELASQVTTRSSATHRSCSPCRAAARWARPGCTSAVSATSRACRCRGGRSSASTSISSLVSPR
jgi:hypothetical protein